MKISILALASILSLTINGAEVGETTEKKEIPYLTGSLLAPVGTSVPYGNFMLKSYLYFTEIEGGYNTHWDSVKSNGSVFSLTPLFSCYFGLTPWLDINIVPQFFFKSTSYEQYFNLGDLTVGLDFQLLNADATPYFPGIKLAVREIFPTGNFEFFQARKFRIAKTGEGSFSTQFDLVFYKMFHLWGHHWMTSTFSGEYTVPTPVDVHGFNSYGGGFGTSGTALPGNQFKGTISFEFTFNLNWALAFDVLYIHRDRTLFFGRPGISMQGRYADVGMPPSEQFSYAVAIEYNLNKSLGMIAGYWASALGKNSEQFQSGVINIEYRY